MIHHLGHVLLERLEPSPQIHQKYWELFVSHAAYRANLTPYNPDHKVDLSWRAGWPRSMISFFAWAEDMIFKDDYYTQLRTATRHSKGALDFMEYDTVAFKWAGILDMYTAEQDAAKKAIAATAEPEAALCAAGAADASALARPISIGTEDAGTANDDTAAKREANRTVEANATIIVEPADNAIELRNRLLSSTAGKAMGQHGTGQCPIEIINPSPLTLPPSCAQTNKPGQAPPPSRPGSSSSSTTASRRARPRQPHTGAPHRCSSAG